VKPLEENSVRLNEGNLGSSGPDSLWKAEETRGIERDILSIKRQAERISAALKSLQTLRETITQSKEAMERLMDK
jgi:prefoldin subunit 5